MHGKAQLPRIGTATNPTRRRLLGLSVAALTLGALPPFAQTDRPATTRRNTAGFRSVQWQDHFESLRFGALVCDTSSMAVHYWSEDERTNMVYPCSVPMSENCSRKGRTEITLKRRNPTWIPTPNMRRRDPGLPEMVPPGPDNPMGTRALNLSWQYYRIHGIDRPAKVGRRASDLPPRNRAIQKESLVL